MTKNSRKFAYILPKLSIADIPSIWRFFCQKIQNCNFANLYNKSWTEFVCLSICLSHPVSPEPLDLWSKYFACVMYSSYERFLRKSFWKIEKKNQRVDLKKFPSKTCWDIPQISRYPKKWLASITIIYALKKVCKNDTFCIKILLVKVILRTYSS